MSEITYAPVIVPVYDRLEHFKRAISALLANDLAAFSVLYVVSDAAYKKEHEACIREVRAFASAITGFKEVHLLFRKTNLGAHESIKRAIDEVLEQHDSFIFLEDDIVVSPGFLRYMNEGLHYYKEEKKVFSICGFRLPFPMPESYRNDVYFFPCNSPWGFASWRDRWQAVDLDAYDRYRELRRDRRQYKAFVSIGFFIKGILQADSEGRIQAMDLRVYYHMFRHGLCSVFPVVSKTQNRGFDGSGEHCGDRRVWWAEPEMETTSRSVRFIPLEAYHAEILRNQRKLQDRINGGWLAKYLKYTWFHRQYTFLKNKWLRK